MGFLDEMSGLELFFACCAAFGGALFIIRLVMMFISGVGEEMDSGDADAGGEGMDTGDMEAMDEPGDYSDSDLSFKALSLQGITAFFMMFGLVGWAVLRQGDYPPLVPIASGTVAGVLTVWIMKKLFQAAGRLQSSGTMNLSNAVGCEGTVYLTVRPGQAGKVQIHFQNRLAVLEAVTEGTEEIKTGDAVRVVRVAAGKLVVQKAAAQ